LHNIHITDLKAIHLGDIVRYNSNLGKLIARARADNPLVIDFSLVFQSMATDFGRVISALREVKAKITNLK